MRGPRRRRVSIVGLMRTALWVAGLAIGLTACSSASQTTPGSAYGTAPAATAAATHGAPMIAESVLKIRKTAIGYVLTNDSGQTLYWYSKDVKGKKSDCTGGCLTTWPAVTGKPVVAAGTKVNGVLGTISRGGGVLQATYNGYPLYTYAGDTSAGQTNGNNVGGEWHVITGKTLTSL
jgi:predicted lipoprotein with Yx(FWY)xxD motif